jgi:Tfp pilus assembly protein PilF
MKVIPLVKQAVVAGLILTTISTTGCNRSPEARAARFLEEGKRQFEKGDYTRAALQFFNAMEATPTVPEPYYQVALAYLASGDTRSGLVYLQKALRKDPKHIPSQVKLCELMLMSLDEDQTAEAKERLINVVAGNPDNVDALTALALAEWQTKNFAEAEKHLRHAIERSPSDMKPLVALTRVKLGQGDMAGAEAVLREAVSKPSPAATAVVAYAELLLLTGRTQEAEQQLKRAAAIDAKNAPALLDLASLHQRAGRAGEAEKLYKQVSQIGKEYRAVHPNYLFMSGRKEEALRLFERLHKDNPEDREARSHLISAYMALDRILDAQKVISTALEKNRKDAEALLQRASLRLIGGDTSGAQADAIEVLRFRPESGEAHYVLSQVHARQGSTLLRKQELGEALKLNASLLTARIELAELMVQTNAAKSALMLLDDTPEHQKRSMRVVLERNRVLMALGDDAAARKEVNQALAAARIPAVLRQQAMLELRSKDYDRARASIQEVLSQAPEDVESVEILARSYIMQGQAKLAVQKIRELVNTRPKSAPLHHSLGQLLVLTGEQNEAKKAFEAARSVDPKFPPATIALAQLEASSGGTDRARMLLSEVLAAGTRNTSARLLLAQVEKASDNVGAAIAQSRKVLETEPRNLIALNNLAYWLADAGQLDEALKYAEQAKEIAPDRAAVADTIGWVMYRKGLYTNAVRHLEDAVAKEPTARRKFHLAMAYHKTGNERQSRETLQAALKLDPAIPEAKLAQQTIHSTP